MSSALQNVFVAFAVFPPFHIYAKAAAFARSRKKANALKKAACARQSERVVSILAYHTVPFLSTFFAHLLHFAAVSSIMRIEMREHDEISTLCRAMVSYFQGDTRRIQHFSEGHALAKCIGEHEGLSAKALYTLEAAALTHDIAIRDCEREFGHCTGKMQENSGRRKRWDSCSRSEKRVKRRSASACLLPATTPIQRMQTPCTVRLSKRFSRQRL